MKKMQKSSVLISGMIALVLFFGGCASRSGEAKPITKEDLPDFKLGSVPANLVTRMHHDLKPQTVYITFSPSNDSVRLYHKMLGDKIWLVLNRENRMAMREAICSYLEQYEKHLLSQADSEKKAYFGSTKSVLLWGVSAGSHRAEPVLRFEYEAIAKRPYFIMATKTVRSKSENGKFNAPALRLAFSPAQCIKLMTLLKEEVLDAVVVSKLQEYNQFDINKQDVTSENELLDFKDELR